MSDLGHVGWSPDFKAAPKSILPALGADSPSGGAFVGRGPGAHSPSGAPGLPASEPRSLAEDLAHRLGRAETLIGYLVDRSEDLVDEVSKARRDEEWLARKALSLWSEINAARVFLAEVGK